MNQRHLRVPSPPCKSFLRLRRRELLVGTAACLLTHRVEAQETRTSAYDPDADLRNLRLLDL
jgi:hypothetical protein